MCSESRKQWTTPSLRKIAKGLVVAGGCLLFGLTVGTFAHYFGATAWGYGLGWDAFHLALFEGGSIGMIFGFIVGLPTYYGILGGAASAKQWLIIIAVTFLVSTVAFIFLSALTIIVAPLATVVAAVVLRSK